jgi:hypothetical protein
MSAAAVSTASTGTQARTLRPSRIALIGLGVTAVAFVVYWLSNRDFDAGRGDFFYLADAFLHGRTWIERGLGPNDVISIDGRVYVPFAPFPAILLAPLVALVGPVTADQWESGVNAFLAACTVGLGWWVSGRIGVGRAWDRLALVLILGFGTQVWWVTTRGGVWHTGHLVAIILCLLMLAELFGRARPAILGLLIGAAFLTRAPIAFAAIPVALWLVPDWRSVVGRGHSLAQRVRALPWEDWVTLGLGIVPALLLFFWYNLDRFGSPLESGYALATLPEWLENQRRLGLFAVAHVGMNLNYLFLKTPAFTSYFPYFKPDGLGMSVLLTSPALFLGLLAPWRDRRTWLLALTVVVILVPTLLYYGGGWLQYGYRYFLDSIPFLWAMVAMWVVKRGTMPWWGWTLVLWGVLVGLGGVYWAYNLR